jgi:hypothetical protein
MGKWDFGGILHIKMVFLGIEMGVLHRKKMVVLGIKMVFLHIKMGFYMEKRRY